MIDPGLREKVVLITGANNPYGIGAGIARAFAAQGAKIFLHYLRQAEASTGNGDRPKPTRHASGSTTLNKQNPSTRCSREFAKWEWRRTRGRPISRMWA